MNGDRERRLAELERQAQRRRQREPIDVEAVIAMWRELSAGPPSEPSTLPTDIAAMSDREAVEEWRRLCRR